MVSTPVQVHPLRTVSPSPPTGKRTRSRAPPRNCPTGKHTRSSAPAQNCIQAHQLASAPVQEHPLRNPAHQLCTRLELYPSPLRQAHPFKRTRSELYPSPPTGKCTRSSAPAQNCIQAHQLANAPVQVHPLRTVSKPTNW